MTKTKCPNTFRNYYLDMSRVFFGINDEEGCCDYPSLCKIKCDYKKDGDNNDSKDN